MVRYPESALHSQAVLDSNWSPILSACLSKVHNAQGREPGSHRWELDLAWVSASWHFLSRHRRFSFIDAMPIRWITTPRCVLAVSLNQYRSVLTVAAGLSFVLILPENVLVRVVATALSSRGNGVTRMGKTTRRSRTATGGGVIGVVRENL